MQRSVITMILQNNKSGSYTYVELMSGKIPASQEPGMISHVRKIVGPIIMCALLLCVLPTKAMAQSEPSTASVSQSSSTMGQQSGATAMIPSPTEAPPEYRVGTGDVLGVTVYNMEEFDRTAVVGSGGHLELSYFPHPLKVDGKTAEEIGREVASDLKRLQILLYPQVDVTVLKVESKPVVVGGDVGQPQVLQEIRPLTLLKALMLARGPESGAGNTVLVTRTDSTGKLVSFDLPLAKVMAGTNSSANFMIKPGDTVQVLPGQKVFVAGAVKTPGAFTIGRNQRLTVSKLMALTGGWTETAKAGKAFIVRQEANGQRKTIRVNLPKVMARKVHDVALDPNDLLYVPSSTGKKVGLAATKGVSGALFLGLGYLILRGL